MLFDYDQIKIDYKKVLCSNFVKNYDYVLILGQFKFVNVFEVDEEINYIGVMVYFVEFEFSEWKKVVKVINKG